MKHHPNNQKRFKLTPSARAIASTMALPLVGGLMLSPVQAQESGSSTTAIEEIIVTATRREGSIQDVPINIAALDGTRLQEQGFSDISEVLAFVPGINAVNQGGRNGNQTIVRGLNAEPLGQGSGNDTGGTVATYLGEIPLPIDLRLNDLQRVEVLLGPQGTLYGAGTLGGAIRYIPNKPDLTESMFEVRGDVYSVGESSGLSTDIGATFNLPVSDTFAIRGSFDRLDDQGFIDYPFVVKQPGVSEPDVDLNDPTAVAANFSPAEDVNSQETVSGRVAARWVPNDVIDATVTYYFQNEENGGRSVSSARGAYPTERYASASRVLEPNEEENELLALEIVADLGFAELTSATGLGKYEEVGQRDQTDLLVSLEYSYETFPTFTALTREEEEEEFLNQEIRLVSTGDGPLNWIVGGFYNKLETVATSAEFTPGFAAFAGFDRADDLEYFSAQSAKVVEQAIFGEIGFDITDKWQITVGGRYYEYDIQLQSTVDFPLFDPEFVAVGLDTVGGREFDPSLRQEDDGSLFKFNTSYAVSEDVTLYATVSEGFRIGGGNGGGECPAYDPDAAQGNCNLAPGQQFGPGPDDFAEFDERAFGPDTTRNFELGAKTEWLDGALTVNGAIFHVEWNDPQLSSATVNASIPITINANGAESNGVELATDWRASERLRLRSSFSYTQSELTADVPSLIRTITPPGFSSAFEDGLDGDRLPGSPETQFSMFANYTIPMAGSNELRLNAGYAWQSDVLSRAGGRGSSLTLDSYGIANLSAVYQSDTWSVSGYVDNVFDEFAETGVQSTRLSNQIVLDTSVRSYLTQVLPPRTVGVRFTYKF
ncbi:TonB-dependent receptor [Arenicella xantha]|uniref:Outer membrane receptor protein involved in Fe transport n=1 Tax=Arenicella xantha TaxID=644221 RepID=A0A395JPW3_9GAMM|nr:TonB-dependent receptor [Arenicella xantha]RBP53649.1 outer membrane receptor protein involved in Fe transport [Arenicella xantha]